MLEKLMNTRRLAWVLTAVVAGVCLLVSTPVLAETVKARVLDVDERKNEVRVDVAGQRRTYNIDDRSLYRVLRPGRLVIITAELVRGRHTIVNAEGATQQGRVVSVDERRGIVTIRDNDSGRTDTYYLDVDVSGRRMGPGDVIRFDVEERGSRSVIVRWNFVGGGGGGGWGGGSSNTFRDAGRVTDVDRRRGQVRIELVSSSREQTFDVVDYRMLDRIRDGDRVAFEYERRSGRFVIVSIR